MDAHDRNWADGFGRRIAVMGVVLPLLFIGGLKFTAAEAEALVPLISGTPWLAWMYPLFGVGGASRCLGIVEIATALLLIASLRVPRAAIAGGALAAVIFGVTTSLLFVLPIWDERSGGFPALNGLGSFLIKDIALFGISVAVLGDGLARSRGLQPSMGRGEDAMPEPGPRAVRREHA